jgi:hypothetical protein
MSLAGSAAVAAGLVLAPICAAGLTLAPSRRVSLLLLIGVFAGAGLAIGLGQQLRIGMSLVATGALAAAILAIGFERAGWPSHYDAPVVGRGFRAATVLLVGAAAWGLAAPYAPALGAVPGPRITSACLILAMGLLQLGLSQEQGAAALGLLTTLGGFELLYAGLEPSLALRAVLAAIMLGIALVSSVLVGQSDPDVRRRSG